MNVSMPTCNRKSVNMDRTEVVETYIPYTQCFIIATWSTSEKFSDDLLLMISHSEEDT